jgi:protein-L-isoaspartate(D-aspartate) O-methyltransferase
MLLPTVVAKLCQSITSVEINEELSDSAKEKLNALNINNAQLTLGDGSQGWQSNKQGFYKPQVQKIL